MLLHAVPDDILESGVVPCRQGHEPHEDPYELPERTRTASLPSPEAAVGVGRGKSPESPEPLACEGWGEVQDDKSQGEKGTDGEREPGIQDGETRQDRPGIGRRVSGDPGSRRSNESGEDPSSHRGKPGGTCGSHAHR